jgi:hypothetical protein
MPTLLRGPRISFDLAAHEGIFHPAPTGDGDEQSLSAIVERREREVPETGQGATPDA